MGKIYFRVQSLFQPLLVCEFWFVILGYCFHVMLVRQQHAVYGLRNALGILAFLQFPYHGEPRAALNQCDHGPLVACSDDQVHLSIPMPCSVCLRRSLVYAGAAFDGHVLSSRALAVLQLMAAVLVQVSTVLLVFPDVLVDSLNGNHVVAFDLAVANYLFRRPLALSHVAVDAVPHLARKGAWLAKTLFAGVCQHLRVRVTIRAMSVAIAVKFTAYD